VTRPCPLKGRLWLLEKGGRGKTFGRLEGGEGGLCHRRSKKLRPGMIPKGGFWTESFREGKGTLQLWKKVFHLVGGRKDGATPGRGRSVCSQSGEDFRLRRGGGPSKEYDRLGR